MVRDLSLGGAMIDEILTDTPIDTPVTLMIDGIAAELAGFVARKDETSTLIKFKLSAEANQVISELVPASMAA
jgi:hypothetical protein